MENEFFSSIPDERDPYTIVIPPPNVTGVLHMGHMLNNTLQDIIIRRARMQGYNACWVPGTDHASIATEAKVVSKLKEQGIEKSDLSRERSEQRPERFAVGDKIDARVTNVDKVNRKLGLSIKAREIAEEKEAVKQYGSSDSGASLGDILGAALAKKDEKSS